ncbi:MAG TPA: acyl carrier protein [Pseudonocardiaceae bacterium]
MLTLDDLRGIMLTCGTDADVDLDSDIVDTPMDQLGFDSLALLHIASLVQRRTEVAIPDHLALELKTPGAVLEFVNSAREAA